MGEVIPFKKRKLSEKFKGQSLCKSGFHKWQVTKEKTFDVKRGKLVTCYICARCSTTKNMAH